MFKVALLKAGATVNNATVTASTRSSLQSRDQVAVHLDCENDMPVNLPPSFELQAQVYPQCSCKDSDFSFKSLSVQCLCVSRRFSKILP